MARSTYYFEISKKDVVAERNQEIFEEINSIFESNKRRYGVAEDLIQEGKKVCFLLKDNQIIAAIGYK